MQFLECGDLIPATCNLLQFSEQKEREGGREGVNLNTIVCALHVISSQLILQYGDTHVSNVYDVHAEAQVSN